MKKTILICSMFLVCVISITLSFFAAAVFGVGVYDYNFSLFHESSTKLTPEEIHALFESIHHLVAFFPWVLTATILVNAVLMVLLIRQFNKEKKAIIKSFEDES